MIFYTFRRRGINSLERVCSIELLRMFPQFLKVSININDKEKVAYIFLLSEIR